MGLHVLVIDDDDDIRTIARLALESIGGMRVDCARSADDGISFLERENTDVVLLDVMMPDCDGPACLDRIRALPTARGSVPVVFMTARTEPEQAAYFLSLGADGVIGKPFDPTKLPDQVRDAVGGRA